MLYRGKSITFGTVWDHSLKIRTANKKLKHLKMNYSYCTKPNLLYNTYLMKITCTKQINKIAIIILD